MPATLPGPPVAATPSGTLIERPGQNRVCKGGHDRAYMALQLQLQSQRLRRPAR